MTGLLEMRVSASLSVVGVEGAYRVDAWNGRTELPFNPVSVTWCSYWSADVCGSPFRHVDVTAWGAGRELPETVWATSAVDPDMPVPDWVPRPPDGWDALVESTWQALLVSREVAA